MFLDGLKRVSPPDSFLQKSLFLKFRFAKETPMETIAKLIQELNGENRKEIIDSFETTVAENITKVIKETNFFDLPFKNFLNIVSKTHLSEQEDPISFIKTIITKTIQAHPKRKKTLLLLRSLKERDKTNYILN